MNLTRSGIETCWLGGTYNKKLVKKLFSFKQDAFIPGIIALGHHADKRNLLQKMIRNAHQRKEFDKLFYNESWEEALTPDKAGVYYKPLEAVRLAPSDMNSQPWRVLKEGAVLHFFMKDMKTGYFRFLDIGIAMCHFDLVRKEDRIEGDWQVLDLADKTKGEYMISFIPKAL